MPSLVFIIPLLFLLLLPISILGGVPEQRSSCATVLIDTTVWFFGGAIKPYTADNAFWSLDLSKSWERAFPPWTDHSDSNYLSSANPRARSTLQAGVDKKTLLVYGGEIPAGGFLSDDYWKTLSTNLFAQYNFETNNWSIPNVQGQTPLALRGHSTVTDNKGIVYYFGGLTPNLTGSATNEYANNAVITMNTTGYMYTILPVATGKVGRFCHTATMVFGAKMYIIGGYFGMNQYIPFSDVDVYDTILNTWTTSSTTTAPTPSARGSHSAALTTDGNTIIIFGGYNSSILGDLWALDVNKFSWTAVQTNGTPPLARCKHSAVIAGTQMLIFFGDSGNNGTTSLHNEIHALDMSTTPWSWVDRFTTSTPGSLSTVSNSTSPAPPDPVTTSTVINRPTAIGFIDRIGGIGGLIGILLGVTSLLVVVGFVVWYCHQRSRRAEGPGNKEQPAEKNLLNGMTSTYVQPVMYRAEPLPPINEQNQQTVTENFTGRNSNNKADVLRRGVSNSGDAWRSTYNN